MDYIYIYIDGSVQDCSNSIANALELLQPCTKPSIFAPQTFWWISLSITEYHITCSHCKIIFADQINIGSGNGLVLRRRHAFSWTNDGPLPWCISPSHCLTCRWSCWWLSRSNNTYIHTYIFVVVNFDALAQASDIRIERRQVVFLCWRQDSNPRSQIPIHQQTECLLTNRLSYRGSSYRTWTRQPVPMISKHSAHSTLLPIGFRTWLWRYTYLLLLISMLWHRQAIHTYIHVCCC